MNQHRFKLNPIPRNPRCQLILRRGGVERTPPSNFVIFKDRDLKFGDNVH